MRTHVALFFVVAVGCKKDPPPTPIAVAPSAAVPSAPSSVAPVAPVPAPSASVAALGDGPTSPAARPRYLRRLRPDALSASSIYDDKKSKERHPANDAFDGDRATSWVEGAPNDGTGEWIEAKFKAPQQVWGLAVDTGLVASKSGNDPFALNAHAKRLRLTIDGADAFAKDVAADTRSIEWAGLDRSLSSLRIVADAVHPGTKWTDFGISEIAILGDATKAPSVPESIVRKEVDALSSPEEAATLLLRFGVVPPKSALDGATAKASMSTASLVDDAGKERVVRVSLVTGEGGDRTEWVATAILGSVDGDRLVVLGSDVVTQKVATDDDVVAVTVEKLHSARVDDVVLRWNAGEAKESMRAFSLEHGFVERIADVAADGAIALEGADPKSLKTDKRTYAFDAKTFLYR